MESDTDTYLIELPKAQSYQSLGVTTNGLSNKFASQATDINDESVKSETIKPDSNLDIKYKFLLIIFFFYICVLLFFDFFFFIFFFNVSFLVYSFSQFYGLLK
jgi:hypothetical protein